LQQQGVPSGVAHQVGALPPVSSLFAAILGVNPIRTLLAPSGALSGFRPRTSGPSPAGSSSRT
jgi:hypothetical protein